MDDLIIGLQEKGVEEGDQLMEITINEFPTHIAVTDNKHKANKFSKLNGQQIYSGAMNRFKRATAMKHLHTYINERLEKYKMIEPIQGAIRLKYEFFTVVNHGDIRRKKDGEISWIEPPEDYIPRWDIDNLAFIWIKGINDCLQHSEIIENDNIGFVKGVSYDFVPVKNYLQRKILIKIIRAK